MRRFVVLAAALGAALSPRPAVATLESIPAPPDRRWSGSNALTLPEGRWELALFRGARYGLTDSLELAVNPLVVIALPHLEAKLAVARERRLVFGVRARVSYPTTFLELVSKEGRFGLLPATSEPPIAMTLETDALVTSPWFEGQLVSAWVGVAVAAHESFTPAELPLLDFPFLYPRFAPLYAHAVPRLGFSFEGVIVGGLHYSTELVTFFMPGLPDVGDASAVEPDLALEYRFGGRVAFSAGLRASYAEYAYGRRTHFLPYVDVRAGF
jgi:hypothetical protein